MSPFSGRRPRCPLVDFIVSIFSSEETEVWEGGNTEAGIWVHKYRASLPPARVLPELDSESSACIEQSARAGCQASFFFFSCLLVMVFKLFSPKQGTVLVRGTWGRLLHLLSHDSLDDGSELWGKSPSVGATLP